LFRKERTQRDLERRKKVHRQFLQRRHRLDQFGGVPSAGENYFRRGEWVPSRKTMLRRAKIRDVGFRCVTRIIVSPLSLSVWKISITSTEVRAIEISRRFRRREEMEGRFTRGGGRSRPAVAGHRKVATGNGRSVPRAPTSRSDSSARARRSSLVETRVQRREFRVFEARWCARED